ncbi:MAG: MATE family efflux transporter [Clostridia bacterium]|nr:MATE family efflux transporter [Clostridia bacterium]
MQLLGHRLDLDKQDMRRILAITMPAMVEMLLAQLLGMVDTIMLGRTGELSTTALAAVGFTNSPINLMIGILAAFNVGTTAAVAWALGAGDHKAARHAASTALGLNLAMGTVISLLGFAFAGPLVTFMGAREETHVFAKQYLQAVAVGMLPAALNMAVTGSLRGAGLTRLPMLYNLGGNIFNVFAGYVMIYGRLGFPAMGVLGAGVSTTISRTLAAAVALAVLYRVDNKIRLRLRESFRIHKAQIVRLMRVGSTTALEQCLMQLGFILFARNVGALGETVFAAHQIGLNINGLSWVPSQAFGVAATALVGQRMGSGEPLKARASAKMVHRMALCCSALVAVLFASASHLIAGLYIDNAEVAGLASGVLRLMALGMPGLATQIPIAAALRGAGDAWFPLIASFIGIWVFRVLVAPLFIHTWGLGLTGAWLSIVLDQTARAIVVYTRFSKGKWMRMRGLATAPDPRQ